MEERFAGPWVVFLLLSSLFGPVGCAQISGLDGFERARMDASVVVEDAGSVDTGVDTSLVFTLDQCRGLPVSGQACATCMTERCCAEAKSCSDDGQCRLRAECESKCEDAACLDRCSASLPLADHAEIQRAHCVATSCATECASSCGAGFNAIAGACLRSDRSCCDAEAAVLASSAGVKWLECMTTCGGWFYKNSSPDPCGCRDGYEGDLSVIDTYQGCIFTCLSRTGLPDWGCAGTLRWPSINNEDAELTLHLRVLDLTTLQPFPGVRVRQCGAGSADCTPVLEEGGTTNELGLLDLPMKRRMQGSDDFFGYLLFTHESIPDTLNYFFPPPRRTFFDTRTQLTSAAFASGSRLIEVDPKLGRIGLQLNDCAGAPAEHVRIRTDPPGDVMYYVGGGQPSRIGDSDQTDRSGLAQIVNLPPGTVHLMTSLADDAGTPLGSVYMQVRANANSVAVLAPTPLP